MREGGDGAWAIAQADSCLAGFDLDGAVGHMSVAIRAFTSAGDTHAAAMACARLGGVFATYIGNPTAARAWFRRASRMLANEPPCVEQGWVAVAAMGCDVDDPAELLANAELALDRARRFCDVNLESKALADAGLAHVQAGRVAEGMALLDEAMALVCGPADDADTAGKSVCSFLTACYFTCEFERAGSWVDSLRRRGLIGSTPGVQMFLASHCDAVHATLLCELGRWGDAETLLTKAIDDFERAMGVPSWHPAIALAELRIRQGRLADAEALLLGKEARMQALLPAARLHLARGDFPLARATARRGLRAVGHDRLRAAELLAVLVEAELGAGNEEQAASICRDLVARASDLAVPTLAARIAGVRARTLAACGAVREAIDTVEDALDQLAEAAVPFLRATLLVDLVRLHELNDDMPAARVEADRASAAIAGLDVVLPDDAVALLDRVRRPHRSAAHGPSTATLAKRDTAWVVSHGAVHARLADSKGLRYLAELLLNPGVERHVLDLVDRVEGVAATPDVPDRRTLGDAGEMLDSQARAAYRRRIEALRSQIDDACAAGADARAERLQDELDQLVAELARAFGLGGRSRHSASAAERARVNVTRALRTAVTRIGDVLPDAGRALDRGLRTGIYCSFRSDDDDVRWNVHRELNGSAAR